VAAASGRQAAAAGDSWLPAAEGKAKERPADRDPESKLLRAAALLLHPEFRARQEQETWLLMVS
jgi:hypothetical protein